MLRYQRPQRNVEQRSSTINQPKNVSIYRIMKYFLSFRNMTTVEIDFAKLSLHNETSIIPPQYKSATSSLQLVLTIAGQN